MGILPEEEMRTCLAYDTPMTPTGVGQRVRSMARAGEVTADMEWGVVTRFNRTGYPVVLTRGSGWEREVTDRWACFRQWDSEGGCWVRPSLLRERAAEDEAYRIAADDYADRLRGL